MNTRITQLGTECFEVKCLDSQHYPTGDSERFKTEMDAERFASDVRRYGIRRMSLSRDSLGFVTSWYKRQEGVA